MAELLYGFAYSRQSLVFLRTLTVKLRRQIISKIEALSSNPYPPKSKKVQGMKEGEDPVHRVRSGNYRVLYTVRSNPQSIVILDIGHRKDIYP